jgi:hypothetical protein
MAPVRIPVVMVQCRLASLIWEGSGVLDLREARIVVTLGLAGVLGPARITCSAALCQDSSSISESATLAGHDAGRLKLMMKVGWAGAGKGGVPGRNVPGFPWGAGQFLGRCQPAGGPGEKSQFKDLEHKRLSGIGS